jgi:hypothetical protein
MADGDAEEAESLGEGLGGRAGGVDAPAKVSSKEKKVAYAPGATAGPRLDDALVAPAEPRYAEPPAPRPLPRPLPPPPPVVAPQKVASPLTAGEIDDNAKFTEYLSYIKSAARGMAADIDVSQRISLKVVDAAGLPVHDASVTLMVDESPWLRARTHSDGSVVLFPNAAGPIAQARAVRLRIEKNGSVAERSIQGGAAEETVTLDVARDQKTRLDLVFCIDTTGSMGDEIAQIQSTVQDIISKTESLAAKPDIRLGMVLYGDRGDTYVTRVYDFTSDADLFKRSVSGIQMTGGGDIPEDLNAGLEDAIESLEWENRDAVRLVFLVGDAAPHLDYGQQYDYKVAMLALFTGGRFLFLTYDAKGAPGGGLTSMHVDRQDYTPDKLDDLVIHIISQELLPLAR